MALTEQLDLDIRSAQQQIERIEQQLSQLARPIDVPIDVEDRAANELAQIRRELGLADDSAEALNRELGQTSDELRTAGRQADRTGDELQSAGRRGQSAFSGLGRTVLGFAAAIGVVQGARAFVNFAGDAITSASDLEQSIGALDAVFGELAGSVEVFGDTADQSVGLARSEFNQLASLLGSQLQTFGFNTADAAQETQNLIVLASDLAATFGGPVSQAVEAISSLLRGEVNPIERYGVAMNQAAVNAKALELGLADGAGELSLQAQTMARLAILTEQTANAQGQFGREADTTAGRLERIRASAENARAELGEALIPAFESLLDITPQLIAALEGLAPVIADISQSFAGAVDSGAGGFINLLGDIPNVAGGVGDVLTEGAQALGNLGLAFGSLATLNPALFFDRLNASIEDFNQLDENLTLRRIREDLLDLLAAGESPLAVLATGIAEVGAATSDLERFGDEVERIFAVTGLQEDAAAIPGLEFLIENADRIGLAADEVEFLVGILNQLQIDEQLDRDISRFQRLAAAARESAGPIELNAEGAAAFRLQVDQIRLDQLSAELEDVAAAFDALPTALDAAAAALEDSEGEIETDFSDFLARLEEELATQRRFQEGIAILEGLGLDDLALFFAEQGTEASEALFDAIENPEEARRAEELLDQQAENLASSFRQTLTDAVTESLDLTIPANVTLSIQQLVAAGLSAADAQAAVGDVVESEVGGVAGPGAGVNVTQNFNGFTPSTPDLTRAAQAINAVVN